MILTTQQLLKTWNVSRVRLYQLLKQSKINYTKPDIGLYNIIDYDAFQNFMKNRTRKREYAEKRKLLLRVLKNAGDKGINSNELKKIADIKSNYPIDDIFSFDDPICIDGCGDQKVFYYIDWSQR